MKRPIVIAIVLSVVLHQVLGYLWYAVLPFAPARLNALGRPLSDLSVVDPVALGMDLVGWIVASVVLAWLIEKTGKRSVGGGAALAVALWIGVAVPAIAPHYAFAHIPTTVTLIDLANSLATLVISGAVIGAGAARAVDVRNHA